MGLTYCSFVSCQDNECIYHQDNAPKDKMISIADRNEGCLIRCPPDKKFSVQMVSDNHDIKVNPKVRGLYPNLYREVVQHDKISHSSWYSLSKQAFDEFWDYYNNKNIGYVY